MRLTVATNFEPELVEGLTGGAVHELFGKLPADALGGGRASYMLSPLSKQALAAHVRDAHRHGIGFNSTPPASTIGSGPAEASATSAACWTGWPRSRSTPSPFLCPTCST
ncbi:MAG: hypothetical protein AABZ83_01190 [candidate division NC10 bacterium]